jgi:tetratricopeptide (TPR) repeat protein
MDVVSGVEPLFALAREHLAGGRLHEAEAALDRALSVAQAAERSELAQRAGLLAQRAGHPRLAVRWYRRAGELAPDDPEPRHDRGIAHLELGEVGLAARAQAEALELAPEHTGARAQLAASLEALGDDAGAARELAELLARVGPQIALSARLDGLRRAAARAAHVRLLGSPLSSLGSNPLVRTVFARQPGTQEQGATLLRATFAALSAHTGRDGRIARLELIFDDMDASLSRSDMSLGGTTEDEHGRRVPLDEFTSTATVFLAQASGIDPLRARRLLQFLLDAEAGLGPHPFAGLQVGWVLEGEGAGRRYGLQAGVAPGPMN